MIVHDAGVPAVHELEIYIVSGGVGASGELLVHTVLAQFPDVRVPVEIFPHVHDPEDVDAIVAKAAGRGALIVHTLVHSIVRRRLATEAARRNVRAIDLMGPLMDYLSEKLVQKPVGEPGLYRKLYDQYFRRVEAIEYRRARRRKRTSELPQAGHCAGRGVAWARRR